MNCSQCGKPIMPGAQFCSGCGAPLAAAYATSPKKGMSAAAIVLVALAVVFVMVAFVGMLVAISVPGFIKARQEARKRACQENLQRIDGAKQQFAIDDNLDGSYVPTWDEIVESGKPGYLQQRPICPAGGNYTINAIDEDPTCSVEIQGHFLP